MLISFEELWSKLPKSQRSDHYKALAGLASLGALSVDSAVSTGSLSEKLKLHLRKSIPRNLSDVLRKGQRHISPSKNISRGLMWNLSLPGIKALSEATGYQIHCESTNTSIGFGDLQTDIRDACENLFKDGHYSEAVGRAAKKLNVMVRAATGRDSDEGTRMMHQVFSPNENGFKRLIIADDLREEWQVNLQQGLEFIMVGVQNGIANVDKHGILNVAGPQDAMEQIVLISLLAKKIDTARLVIPNKSGDATNSKGRKS